MDLKQRYKGTALYNDIQSFEMQHLLTTTMF